MLSDQFQQLMNSTVEALRLGMEAQGSEGLIALIDALPLLLQGGAGLEVDRFNQLLANMLAAQGRKDYLYLADLLQYELASQLAIDSRPHLAVQGRYFHDI